MQLIKLVRLAEGRDGQPSLTSLDSQSVKISENRGPKQGIEKYERVKGCKRHIVVDTSGWVLNCFISVANMADIKAAVVFLEPVLEACARIEKVLADQACKGDLGESLEQIYHCVLEVTTKLCKIFVPAPYRWVIERTFSLLEKARRLCRDYEVLLENPE